MGKNIKYYLFLITVFILLIFAVACVEPEDSFNGDDGNTNTVPFRLTDSSNYSLIVSGRVRDAYFNIYSDISIIFEVREEQIAAVSDENGLFTFYILANNNADQNRVRDFIGIDSSLYDYVVLPRQTSNINNLSLDIVFTPKGSEINIFNLINVSSRISFNTSGLPLPAGYLSRGYPVSFTEAGETIFRGVDFYINGNLIGTSHDHGFDLEGILPGSIIKVEREGFHFFNLAGSELVPLVVPATEISPEYRDSFIAGSSINIRGELNDGVKIEDLDI